MLEESASHMTGVNVVQRQYNTQEKADLWRKFLKEEFKDQYKEVNFNSQDPKSANFNSGIDNVITQKSVRIALTNKQHKREVEKDRILEKTMNPIKQVIFTKDRVNDISFDSQDINQANQKLKKIN